MGTKINPGKFDCHAAALPDEPMFILLARDPLARHLVAVWAALRLADDVTARAEFGMAMGTARRLYTAAPEAEKAGEAFDCANQMGEWRYANDGAWRLRSVGRCRICGCTDTNACVGIPVREGVFDSCSWADAAHTLCSNPECLARATA